MAGQNKALILLVLDQVTELILWQQKHLSVLADFRNTPDDHERFLAEVRKYPEHPVIVVADLIDENFRHDLIVHVGGNDREALIRRKLDFTFRTTRYRIGRIKGREKDGRKQDKLLLAAISKPEMIDIWINLLLADKRPIQGITSLAWLLRSYLPLKKLDKEQTLLVVSIDPCNCLRQSFFADGKLMFSRLTNLTYHGGAELAAAIHNETLQVRQYLERIQFVQYEAPLHIQVIAALGARQLPLADYSTEINRFEHIDCSADIARLALGDGTRTIKPVHYVLAQVLATSTPPNVYAPPAVTRYHDLLRLGSLVGLAAGVVMLIGIGGNLPLALGVKDKWDQAANFEARTQPLLLQYDSLSRTFPATPIPSVEMALVVDAYKRIKQQLLNPVAALNMITAAMTQTDGVLLTSIQWELVHKPFVPGKDENGRDLKEPAALKGVTGGTEFAGAVLQRNTMLKIIINGESYSPASFREAQDQVQQLVTALAKNADVTVFATRMPTEIRTDVVASAEVDDSEVRAPFTLELTQTLQFPDADAVAQQVAVQP